MKPNTTIIGAGIVGMSTADFMQKAGHDVTVSTASPPQRWRHRLPTRARSAPAIPRPGPRPESR